MTESWEQAYKRRFPQIHQDVRSILLETFPSISFTDANDISHSLISLCFNTTGLFSVLNHEKEAEKLAKLKNALLEANRLFEDLHSEVKNKLMLAIIERPGKISTSRGAIHTLQMIDQTLVPAIDTVLPQIEDFSPQGKTNWRAVSVFAICREIWVELKGVAPPDHINEATPFAEFSQSILDQFELGKVRSAAQSLLKLRKQADQRPS